MRHPFLRTLAGASAVATDPNFENVTLLLHGDGTNGGQNNTFVDGSTNNFTITRNGNTTQGTFSPYGDNWSNYFDTSNTSLVATGTTSTGNLPTSTDFTIEFWWRSKLVNSGTGVVVGKTQFVSTSADSWWVEVNGSNKVAFVGHNGASIFTPVTSTTSVMDGVWHHCAISRAGTTYRVFVDGALEQTTTNSTTMNQGSRNITFAGISTNTGQNYGATGYISNLRIVVGTCLYTAAFTPSTAPLTSVTNTVLLTCQSNRFKDNGPNAYTISTQQGTPSVQRFSPFSPTAAYAAGTIGGSGYFDGTGDCLVTPADTAFQLGTGDFSVELWYYATTSATSGRALFGIGNDASGAIQLMTKWPFGGQPDNRLLLNATAGPQVVTDTVFAVNSWNHIALSRASGTVSIYLNGTRVGNGSFTQNITANQLVIGRSHTAKDQEYVAGYISNFRLVKGTALYSGTTITVPTTPLTAITDTQLLCIFTNAAILDNAMMAVPETVGNAQIDTTTKKFGTGSLEFDGTGDWLLVPDSPDQRLGTGNFTIECWLYLSATGTARGVVGKGTSTTGWLLSTNTSNAVVFTYGTSTITSTGTLSGTTWYHIAVVREGTGTNQTKIYIGGTNDGTGTVSTDFTQTNAAYVGANRTGADPMNGYIDDLRITKGVARYTANFTAPTAAFPDL